MDPLLKNCEIFKLGDMDQYQVCLFMEDFNSKNFLTPLMVCFVSILIYRMITQQDN